jgi:hypothetical protein
MPVVQIYPVVQTYVVRIYRRTRASRLTGTVEFVHEGRIAAFRSFRALQALLRGPTAGLRATRRKERRG